MSMIHISNPNTNSFLTDVKDSDIQPNATDVRLDKVFEISMESMFILNEVKKKHHQRLEMETDQHGFFLFRPNQSYEVIMKNIIKVGEGEAGLVIVRSTLNRNGLFLTSGLYDSGYHGVIAGVLHNRGGPAFIGRGTRIGQFLLFKAEALHQYNGSYGLGKEHDQKVYKSK